MGEIFEELSDGGCVYLGCVSACQHGTSGEYQFSEEDSSFWRVRIREKLNFSYLLYGFGIYLMFVEFVGIVLVEISSTRLPLIDLR